MGNLFYKTKATMSLTMLNNLEEHADFVKEGVCIIDAFATWCPPCVNIAPKYEAIAKEFDGKVKFGKFDVDQAAEIAQEVKINCMPTFIVYKGGAEVDRMEGASEQGIRDICNKHA